MANLTLRSGRSTPLTIAEVDSNFTNLNTDKLEVSEFNGSQILARLLIVDGQGSGLDADVVRGQPPTPSNSTNTLVSRDSSGSFASNIITATRFIGSLTGNADTATNASTVTNGIYSNEQYNNPSWIASLSGAKLTAQSVPNAALANSSITIDGTAVSLGGSINLTTADLSWTGTQTFRDNRFLIADDGNTTRRVAFQCSGISNNTTRTLTIPNSNGTIALAADVDALNTTVQNEIGTLVKVKGFISFNPSTGAVFSSRNLTIARDGVGIYTITLDASIRPGDTSYAAMVGAIDKGTLQAASTAAGAMDIRTIGIDTYGNSSFVVRAIRRFNSGLVQGGGNDANSIPVYTGEGVDPLRITVVVF